LEPSYEIVLENHFHKFPRRARQAVKLQVYGPVIEDAKVSKSPILVNRKIAEIVPIQEPQDSIGF